MSAFDSAFLRRLRRNSADFLGQRALETPNCLPAEGLNVSNMVNFSYPEAMKSSRRLSIPSLLFQDPNLESAAVVFPSSSHLDDIISRTLRSPPGTPSIPPHGHSLFMIDHIVQICQRALELPSIDSLSGFTGVFEGDAEVGAVSAGRFALLDRCGCVADLHEKES